jgi:hypothetical protein
MSEGTKARIEVLEAHLARTEDTRCRRTIQANIDAIRSLDSAGVAIGSNGVLVLSLARD